MQVQLNAMKSTRMQVQFGIALLQSLNAMGVLNLTLVLWIQVVAAGFFFFFFLGLATTMACGAVHCKK